MLPGMQVSSARQAKIGGKRMTLSCDNCRRKKTRCDARQPSCANCENAGIICQTGRPARKRGRKVLRPSPATTQTQHQDSPTAPRAQSHSPDNQQQQQQQRQQQQQSPAPTGFGRPFSDHGFSPPFNDMARHLASKGVAQDPVSYTATCVQLFFQNIYPTYPVLYRPAIHAAIEKMSMPGEHKAFALVTATCAYTLAVLPVSLNTASWAIAEVFYRASKQALDLYTEADIENPDHTSIVIRMFHSGWIHVAGKTKASWYILGECIRIAQSMRLHDERSYENMSWLEGQLCRRVFWTLYTGDKSAAVLGHHPICLKSDMFEEGITVHYPEAFANQDIVHITSPTGSQQEMSLMDGFIANQTLWRAAETLLVMESRDFTCIDTHLTDLLMAFHTCLDGLPYALRFHNHLATSLRDFAFAEDLTRVQVPLPIAIQRTNIQISFQCLKMVILRKFTTSEPVIPPVNAQSPALSGALSGTTFEPHAQSSPSYILQTLKIADDMLYIIHTSSLDLVQLNGEACAEKIRLVGASILELIARNPDSLLIGTAKDYRELFPHILAMLDSKASESACREDNACA
ncbi:hypothetical protein DM02DRAFT_217056 [Periconia macrospinosa]|uniref:Zn(2)-C6 fungal-type domain-containing protein n=1 Tax=Periconia macrospinosa TaxID=97972 RepID=A0A2V1D693_9PLEO|nr:hypothetical protein DM02DRAFT_217056 [Periconia macrospinosa]